MSKWICFGWLSLAAPALLSACGSDEAGGGSGGSGGATGSPCVRACQRLSSAACGDYANTDCLAPASCPVEEACPGELDTFYGCIATTATMTCSAGQTRTAGCESQATSYVECASCKVLSTDGACGTCVKTSCCDELTAYNVAPDGVAFDACLEPCELQSCVDACVTSFPVAGAAYNATLGCQETSCTRPCVCGVTMADDTCSRCVKSNCCDSLVAYNQAADVAGFSACLQPCLNQACADACVARFPTAGAAYVNLVTTCLDTTCATACASAP